MKNKLQDVETSSLGKHTNKKWYPVPNAESWQYAGLMFGTLILMGFSLFDIGLSIVTNGENFLEHLNWILVGATLAALYWYSIVPHIQEEWDSKSYDERDNIENIQENLMYTPSLWKYLFCRLTLFISWGILIGYVLYWFFNIEKVVNEHPARIIIGLLVVIAIILYKRK